MEAEIGVMWPQPSSAWSHQALEEAWNDLPLEAERQCGPTDTLIVGFCPPELRDNKRLC